MKPRQSATQDSSHRARPSSRLRPNRERLAEPAGEQRGRAGGSGHLLPHRPRGSAAQAGPWKRPSPREGAAQPSPGEATPARRKRAPLTAPPRPHRPGPGANSRRGRSATPRVTHQSKGGPGGLYLPLAHGPDRGSDHRGGHSALSPVLSCCPWAQGNAF